MAKGGGGSSTTNTVATPWEGQQPYLTDVFAKAQQSYNAGNYANPYDTAINSLAPAYYQGGTLAGQSQNTLAAQQMQANRAIAGDDAYGTLGNASRAANKILTGQTMSGNTGLQTLNQLAGQDNPYVDELYRRANSQAQAGIDSSFNQAGRYGSGAMANAKAEAANNLATDMYANLYDKRLEAARAASGEYNAGLDAQLQAMQTGQELANQRYKDAAALSEAGQQQDAYRQAQIDADIDRYNYNAQRALTALSNYNQLIQGTYGGTTTETGKQGYKGSALGTTIGGLTAAASLAAALGGDRGLLSYFE